MNKRFDEIAKSEADKVRYHIEQVLKDISWEKAHPNKLYGNVSENNLLRLNDELKYHERRIPKPMAINRVEIFGDDEFYDYSCPECKHGVAGNENYCSNCGQRLNTSIAKMYW